MAKIRSCVLIAIIAIFPFNYIIGQERGHIDFVFYNAENLFDVKDDPLTSDEEFLPDSEKHWTYERYMTKIDHIARVLVGIGKWELPGIIGLCEVENEDVLYELAGHRLLKEAHYRIIHQDSPDSRGIDVAMLYRAEQFEPLHMRWFGIRFPGDTSVRTRDILYVKGLAGSSDTIHIFINHWPSRWGGVKATNPKRVHVARQLKMITDSLFRSDQGANILISGDFNDNPHDSSLFSVLDAGPLSGNPAKGLVNMMYPASARSGSLKYRENWETYDQIIVSASMLTGKGLRIRDSKAYIFSAEFLLENDERYMGTKPWRTYAGPRYLGGFSDHLPVYTTICIGTCE